ncbi:MAG: hypothetical protein DRJ47_00270 [Thermoprotei archaeon]|nr:MAG: hypothetical protein DRJ47_00270 [Thermoprotei archaeon]
MNPASSNIIITHGDLDGLTAAAILLDYIIQKDVGKPHIEIAQPYILQRFFKRFYYNRCNLWILDLALDENTWFKISPFIIEEDGREIVWIDHHRSTLVALSKYKSDKITLIFSLEKCTAELVEENFGNQTSNPSFYKTLAEIGSLSDKNLYLVTDKPLSRETKILEDSLLYLPSDIEFKKRLIEFWVNEQKILSEEITARARKARDKLRKLHKIFEGQVVFSTDLVEIIDLREINVRGYVGKIASERAESSNKITFVFFQPSLREIVLTMRVPSKIEFNVLEIVRKLVEKYRGAGGGHPKAASVRVPRMAFDQIFLELKKISMKINA